MELKAGEDVGRRGVGGEGGSRLTMYWTESAGMAERRENQFMPGEEIQFRPKLAKGEIKSKKPPT